MLPPRSGHCWPAPHIATVRSLNSPVRNPFTTRDGIPRVRSMTAIEEAKYSQCPCLRSKRKLARGSCGTVRDSCRRVAEMGAQIGFEGRRFVVVVARRSGNLFRQLRNAGDRARGQSEVAGAHIRGIDCCPRRASREPRAVRYRKLPGSGSPDAQDQDRKPPPPSSTATCL